MRLVGGVDAGAHRGDADDRSVDTAANGAGFTVVGVKGELRFYPSREQLALCLSLGTRLHGPRNRASRR